MSESPTPSGCPPDAELVDLLEGRLQGPAVERLEDHVGTCSACQAFFDDMTEEQDGGGGEPAAGLVARIGLGALGRGASIGRYLILSLLGRGGMGEVYAAYDPDLDRRVAVKLLHFARGSQGARERLLREARALGKFSHPNVVQVYDVGEHEGDVFVAMELVDGCPLDAFCEGPHRPGWREVLAAYLDAARGLGAAHEKGIVHRDVKPSNILRGKDGRVRVADFGLAAVAAREPEGRPSELPTDGQPFADPPAIPSSPAGRLTRTGALVGTPFFMAPEQFEGPAVTPASDQHSLCTALHQGLYGALPFPVDGQGAGPADTPREEGSGLPKGGRTFEALARVLARKREGPPPSPPAGSSVPAWVYRALSRGLSPRPEDRYPSMDALVAALSADPEARRRPWWPIAALSASAVLAVAAVGAARGAFENPCAHPERELSGVWDEGIKDRTRAAFLGTGRPYAGDTAARSAALLDGYGTAWSAMRAEVCEASRSGKQRREIAGLRDECLDRRLGQLRALAAVFAEKPDPQVLDKAVTAAAGLPPVASCADVEALAAPVRLPEDPAIRARVGALQPRIDRLEALHRAGKYKEGLALGEPLLAEATAIPHPPLVAQARFWMGQLRDKDGGYEAAEAHFREAAFAAVEGRDDLLAGLAWGRMLFVVAERLQELDRASALRAVTPAVARAKDARVVAEVRYAEASLLQHQGKFAEARAAFEQALAAQEASLGPDHPDVASTLGALGGLFNDTGDYPAALRAHERALAIKEKALGPDHPSVATTLSAIGVVLLYTDQYERAIAMEQRALAIWEASLGPEHPNLAYPLLTLGLALSDLDEHSRALPMLERALAIWEKALGPDHLNLAYCLVAIADVHVHLGQLDAAVAPLERARAVREKALPPTHPDMADVHHVQGVLSLARGDPGAALPLLERALAVANERGKPSIRMDLAEGLWRLGRDRGRARVLAEEARTHFERLGDRRRVDRARRWLEEHRIAPSGAP